MAEEALIGIGAFAQATGLTIKALRLYAEAGVLIPARVDQRSGYRRYRREQVRCGQRVRTLRAIGVPVAELGSMLAAIDAGRRDVAQALAERIHADEELTAHRRRLLATLTNQLEGTAMPREITVRTWHADPALIVRVDIAQAELDQFVRTAYQTLYTAAGRGPLTMSAPGYQRYHARVADQDTPVTIEACLPFAADRAQPDALPVGVEVLPARTMTFVSTTMRGHETVYPTILEGSDAVAVWITRHNFDFDGPAYEIARRWSGTVGDPANVFEVGFPVAG